MIRNNSTFILSMVVSLLTAASIPSAAHAWGGSASTSRGGSASWGGGSGSASSARGGSASWSHGTGSATTAQGGSAAWSHGTGYAHGAAGGTAAWSHGGAYYGGYHPPAYGYHPPAAYYGGGYSSGQVAGAAVVGMAVGAMAGAAAASSHSAPPPSSTTVVVQEAPGTSQMPIGAQVTVLPGNCGSATVGGVEYYQCGPNWFKPYFGNSSVYYRVVTAPY